MSSPSETAAQTAATTGPAGEHRGTVLTDLRDLWRLRDVRRLLSVRLASQTGDGLFQVGLATLFFFSATTSPQGVTVGQVAAAFAVMLLPFTIAGPWAGVLLDRWRRRQVLLVGNLLRAAIAVVLAVLMATTGTGPAVYVLALVALSVNRFLLAALSASLPRVAPREYLLTANSLVPTLGSVASGIGAGLGFATRLFPAGHARDAASLALAALAFVTSSVVVTRLGAAQLGPDSRPPARALLTSVGRTTRDLADGWRYLVARRTPAQGLAVVCATRFLYGMVFIAGLLACRNLLSDPHDADAGLAKFLAVLGASAVGFALAIVLTPTLSRHTGAHRWITGCLALGVLGQLLITIRLTMPTMLVSAVVLGLAAQGAKIAVDTIVQRDADDAYRGRAFSLYDVLYNAGFVGAAAIAAVTLPDEGYSAVVFACLTAAYLALAVVFGRWGARQPAAVAERAGSTAS